MEPTEKFYQLKEENKLKANFVSQNNIFGEYMFVIVNKIDCISCFKYHMTELNKIGITKIYYSPDNYELVQNHLNNCIELSQKHINTDKGIFLQENLAIAFINIRGKIIYSDVADKTNYEKSRVFYQIIYRFTKK